MNDGGSVHFPIRSDADLVTVRMRGRELAAHLGFGSTDVVLIATAISELARNILTYATVGEIVLKRDQRGSRRGLTVIASDAGPGIADLDRAMQDGYSTSASLGLGLPGTRRLMDDFAIDSHLGVGTTVTATKWAPEPAVGVRR